MVDLRRTVLFLATTTDHIRFFSEVEYEHALTTSGTNGEVGSNKRCSTLCFVAG